MTSISSLSSSSRKLYLPPLGIPDPSQERPPIDQPDTRDRVAIVVKRGLLCWLNAFNAMRFHFAARNVNQFPQEKELEQAAKWLESKLEEIDKTFLFFTSFADGHLLTKECFQNCSKSAPITLWDEKAGQRVDLTPYILEFRKQDKHQNLVEYVKEQCSLRKIEAYKSTINRLGSSFDDIIMINLSGINLDKRQRFKTWDLIYKCHELEPRIISLEDLLGYALNLTRIKFAERMHLKPSQWTPDQSIEVLIQQINEYGPHCVSGCLGVHYYKAPPQKAEVIDSQVIYGWRPTDRIEGGFSASHAVILVGAKKVEEDPKKSRVYFIDPSDGSNPLKPAERRIYVMSYARLRDEIVDQLGFKYIYFSNDINNLIYAYRSKTLEELRSSSASKQDDSKTQ